MVLIYTLLAYFLNFCFLALLCTNHIDHGRHLIIDMFTHNICCSFLLTFADILDNCRMFCNELWMCFFTLQIFHTITVHLFTQVIQKQNQFLIIRCHVNDIMETYICFGNLCDILVFNIILNSSAAFFISSISSAVIFSHAS